MAKEMEMESREYPGRGEDEFGNQLTSPATTGQSYNLFKMEVGKGAQDLLEFP